MVVIGFNLLSLVEEGFDLVVKNLGILYDMLLVVVFVKKGMFIIIELELGY